MPKIAIVIADGQEKENVSAVILQDKRWGQNGAEFGTLLDVKAGRYELTVLKSSEPKSLKIFIEVTDNDEALRLFVGREGFDFIRENPD